MGNTSTRYSEYQTEKPDYLADFFGKETNVDEDYDIFVTPTGRRLPYKREKWPEQASDIDLSSSPGPESIAYVEIVTCKGNLEEFAVHHKMPDHECGANCKCIKKLFVLSDKRESEAYDMKGGNDATSTVLSDSDRTLSSTSESDDGILMGSDVTSSELYKMQERIFGSNTEDSDLDDEFTSGVEKGRISRRNQLFDSEEELMLHMSSPSLSKEPIRRNNKYH